MYAESCGQSGWLHGCIPCLAGYDGRHLQLVRAVFRECREVELLMRNSFCGSSTFVLKGIRWRRGPVASLGLAPVAVHLDANVAAAVF